MTHATKAIYRWLLSDYVKVRWEPTASRRQRGHQAWDWCFYRAAKETDVTLMKAGLLQRTAAKTQQP